MQLILQFLDLILSNSCPWKINQKYYYYYFLCFLKLKEHLWKYKKLAPKQQQQQSCPKLPLVILYLLADIK
jgi:hypothetical protein